MNKFNFNYINKLSINDIRWSSYFKNNIENYNIFEKLFDDEVKNFYLIKKTKIESNNLYILNFYYNHTLLADFIENIFYDKMKTINNSVTLVYIKDFENILVFVKSFEMIEQTNKIMGPFFKYFVSRKENTEFFQKLNNSFKNEEKVLIINYQN
tara:strand:+ start:195 stop:656 length:462 start_codon:yes stop_codon:yes gene_type:complete